MIDRLTSANAPIPRGGEGECGVGGVWWGGGALTKTKQDEALKDEIT